MAGAWWRLYRPGGRACPALCVCRVPVAPGSGGRGGGAHGEPWSFSCPRSGSRSLTAFSGPMRKGAKGGKYTVPAPKPARSRAAAKDADQAAAKDSE
jgi:hypothetical protein